MILVYETDVISRSGARIMGEARELLISVIMPVYNTPLKMLDEAVQSILTQTLREFEFIIIDDCSDYSEMKVYLSSLKD